MDYEGVRRLAIGVIAFWVGQHTGQMPQLDGAVKRVSQKSRLKKEARDFVQGGGLEYWCDVAGVDADRLRARLKSMPK